MAEINQHIIALIKYDYKYLFFFNNQMNSFKGQFVQKYNKNKYQIYLITREKNIKRLKKKKYYEDLYLKNKYMYYIIFTEKVMSKYFRKQLYKDLLTVSKTLIINIIFELFGIKKLMNNYLPI